MQELAQSPHNQNDSHPPTNPLPRLVQPTKLPPNQSEAQPGSRMLDTVFVQLVWYSRTSSFHSLVAGVDTVADFLETKTTPRPQSAPKKSSSLSSSPRVGSSPRVVPSPRVVASPNNSTNRFFLFACHNDATFFTHAPAQTSQTRLRRQLAGNLARSWSLLRDYESFSVNSTINSGTGQSKLAASISLRCSFSFVCVCRINRVSQAWIVSAAFAQRDNAAQKHAAPIRNAAPKHSKRIYRECWCVQQVC